MEKKLSNSAERIARQIWETMDVGGIVDEGKIVALIDAEFRPLLAAFRERIQAESDQAERCRLAAVERRDYETAVRYGHGNRAALESVLRDFDATMDSIGLNLKST